MGGLPPPPTPCFFNTMQANFKYLRTSKEPIWTLSEPVTKVFANGGAAPPPTPQLFFCTMQARKSHHQHKNCVKHVVVVAFF